MYEICCVVKFYVARASKALKIGRQFDMPTNKNTKHAAKPLIESLTNN